jgi:hypothetical protein
MKQSPNTAHKNKEMLIRKYKQEQTYKLAGTVKTEEQPYYKRRNVLRV